MPAAVKGFWNLFHRKTEKWASRIVIYQEAYPKSIRCTVDVENDTLEFKVNLKEKPLTRRGVLSILSSIYDPLGLCAPFLLKGKQIMQKLCQLNLKWDEDIPDEISNEWLTWKENLPN